MESFPIYDQEGQLLGFDSLVDNLIIALDESCMYFYPDSVSLLPSKVFAIFQENQEPLGGYSISLNENEWVFKTDEAKNHEYIKDDRADYLPIIALIDVAKRIHLLGNEKQALITLMSCCWDVSRLSAASSVDVFLTKEGYALPSTIRSKLARSGANSRHQVNRVMKAEIFAWLEVNMLKFKSMDSAAEAIAGKVAPITFRTARAWVGEWKKKRSAGRP